MAAKLICPFEIHLFSLLVEIISKKVSKSLKKYFVLKMASNSVLKFNGDMVFWFSLAARIAPAVMICLLSAARVAMNFFSIIVSNVISSARQSAKP